MSAAKSSRMLCTSLRCMPVLKFKDTESIFLFIVTCCVAVMINTEFETQWKTLHQPMQSFVDGNVKYFHVFYFFFCFLHRALWYNYTAQTNEMHNYLNISFLTFPTRFVRFGFILKETVLCAVCYVYMHLCEQSGRHTDAFKTFKTTLCKYKSPWRWSQDVRNM